MTLAEFRQSIFDFSSKRDPEKIKIFAWFLHIHEKRDTFNAAALRGCYEKLHEVAPSSFSGYLQNLVDQKLAIKSGTSYRLTAKLRDELSQQYSTEGHKI